MMPYVMGALRISYGIGWKISLVAELLGSTSGLGYLMLRAQGSADMTTVMAASLAIVHAVHRRRAAGARSPGAPLSSGAILSCAGRALGETAPTSLVW